MGRPFSVTLDDIHMIWTENDVFKPLKPLFYKRYVDDIFRRRKKNYTDQLYHELNNYHPNINLTIEINPKMFLDTQVITQNGKIETTVYRKSTNHRYQLHLNDIKETQQTYILEKFLAVDYPQKFVESVICHFQNGKIGSVEDDYIIARHFLI